MKIVVFSDSHGMHESLSIPRGDVLIHAGDFSRRGLAEEAEAFDQFLARQPHRHKIVIAGNHDFQMAAAQAPVFAHAHYLQDSSVTLDGVRFYGSPWQPEFGAMAFNLPRGELLASVWENIPEAVDVLVTHTPPHGILDQIQGGISVGCEALRERVMTVRPALHVFGHVHEGYGRCELGDTQFVNAASCTFGYDPVNPCVVITI